MPIFGLLIVLLVIVYYILGNNISIKNASVTTKDLVANATTKDMVANTDDADFSWVVMYHHLTAFQEETKRLMQSYEMFHNKQIYQKVLYVWDSSQGDSLEGLLPYIPAHLSDNFLHIDLATESTLKQVFGAVPKNGCFGRDVRYCEMLFVKTQLDVLFELAAVKYNLKVPKMLALADGDTYWHTLPVQENVIDANGRLLVHTVDCVSVDQSHGPGVKELLSIDHYLNGMVAFPVHVWFETLSEMRNKIVELDRLAKNVTRSWFEIYLDMTSPLCEFCLIATYAQIYEPERYRFVQNPCLSQVVSQNAFLSSNSSLQGRMNVLASLPMVYTMVHDKVRLSRSQISVLKGCCLTYRLNAIESNGKCIYTVSDFHELVELDPWNHLMGYTSPTLLSDHFERVWRTVRERSPEVNQRSIEACLRFSKNYP
jgi:hypothetical protein